MPGRPLPHRLRRLTWLSCVPVAIAVILSSIDLVHDDPRGAVGRFRWVRPQVTPPAPATKPIDNTLIRLVQQMYPESSPIAILRSNQESAASIPPLRAFAISMWIHGESGETTLSLRCKDPAHDIVYCIGTDRPDQDVRLIGVDVNERVARFTVRRGDEQHTFLFDRSREFHSSVIRFSPPESRDGGGAYYAPVVASTKHPDLKAVPYFDDRGQCIGMRVTGIRSDSDWAKRGVLRGDVLLTADGMPTHEPAKFRKRVRSGWTPTSIRIGRLTRGQLREARIGG